MNEDQALFLTAVFAQHAAVLFPWVLRRVAEWTDRRWP